MSETPATRQHETVIEIPAPVEEVWKAITEATEIQRWFAPEVKTDPRPGGEYSISWGPGMEGRGVYEVVDKPHHVRTVSIRKAPGSTDEVRLAMDYYIEARGGTTILRLVHSGFPDAAGWEHEFNGTRTGWPIYFRVMRHGLTRHRGAQARNFDVYGVSGESLDRTWELLGELRPADAHLEGERCAWWLVPGKNDAMVHLACSLYGPKAGFWVNVATYDLPESAVAELRSGFEGRLRRIFPEQQADVCA